MISRATAFDHRHRTAVGTVTGALPALLRPRRTRHGLQQLLGEAAWGRLPEAVRARFADQSRCAQYRGEFEIVRASQLGKTLAWLCQLIGTPIAPRTGCCVPAVVRVEPTARGVEWRRDYHWPDHSISRVSSTKVIGPSGTLIEELPARLCMELDVREESGSLLFVSRRYYFDLSLPWLGSRRLALPRLLCPGTTRVEHCDESQGWFRFTMTVTHPVFGELFYQTGRFCDPGG